MVVVEAEAVEKPKLVKVELLCMVQEEAEVAEVLQPVVVLLVEHGEVI